MDDFIGLRNGLPAGFRYLIWSRSRLRCELQDSIQFTSTYLGHFSIDLATRANKKGPQLALRAGDEG